MTRPGVSSTSSIRAVGRRQHRDPPAYPERRHPGAGGAVPERVAAAEGASCNFLFAGFTPSTGTTTRTITSKGAAGAAPSTTTATAPVPEQRQLPQHPGRDPGDEIPVHRRGVPACARLAGAGRWRGGLASSRTFRVTAPEITINALRPHADPRTRASSAARREPAAASSSSVPATTGSVASRRRSERSPIPSSRASR